MNKEELKKEINKRIFGWIDKYYKDKNLIPGSIEALMFSLEDNDYEKYRLENNKKYMILEVKKEDYQEFGMPLSESLVVLIIKNKMYAVAISQRLYCKLEYFDNNWISF